MIVDAFLMNTSFEIEAVIDTFESFIWAERYSDAGDFELYMPASSEIIDLFRGNKYIGIRDSNTCMVVEKISIECTHESGDHIIVSGRTLSSILDRRIISKPTVLSGSFQNGIKKLITDNVIAPELSERVISGFKFKESSDPRILNLTLDVQLFGENLFSIIKQLCDAYGLGFRVNALHGGYFEFELYMGEDRSCYQIKNVPVMFSSKLDNLLSSNYVKSYSTVKNSALVAGAGEDSSRQLVWVFPKNDKCGLDRRELFVDASEISKTADDGEIPAPVYTKQLEEKGKLELSNYQDEEMADGKVDSTVQYVYGKDFAIGDIVQVIDKYGNDFVAQILEVARVHDVNGEYLTPTFVSNGLVLPS